MTQRGIVESGIVGAIRSAIDAHGPVTRGHEHSAAKRIIGYLKECARNDTAHVGEGDAYPHAIPAEIISAARQIETWMIKQNQKHWQLLGICDRRFAYDTAQAVGEDDAVTNLAIRLAKGASGMDNIYPCDVVDDVVAINKVIAQAVLAATRELAERHLAALNKVAAMNMTATRELQEHAQERQTHFDDCMLKFGQDLAARDAEIARLNEFVAYVQTFGDYKKAFAARALGRPVK